MKLRPNPTCEDSYCQARQKEFNEKPKPVVADVPAETVKEVHEDNEWGKNYNTSKS